MLSASLRAFHDKVFVLTLDGDAERQENVRQQLGTEGIEFVYGLDKRGVTKQQLIDEGIYDEELARRTDPHDRVMTLGQICCTLGHRWIYEKILDSDCERALIFEDDVVAFPVSEERIDEAVSSIPPDAELIYWGYCGGRFSPPLGQVQQAILHMKHAFGHYKHNHRMIRNVYMRRYNDFFDVAAVNFLAHAYTVTRSAAEVLRRRNDPIVLNADHVLVHAVLNEEIRAYVAREKLFWQRSNDPHDPTASLTE
jgi:glycosyl transferase family 25